MHLTTADVLWYRDAMNIYAEELRIIIDVIMDILFYAREENLGDVAFHRLLDEIEVREYPESVKTLCQQAANTWFLSGSIKDTADKTTLQQSAVVYLLAAFGRINALAATEEYILQRNKDLFDLR